MTHRSKNTEIKDSDWIKDFWVFDTLTAATTKSCLLPAPSNWAVKTPHLEKPSRSLCLQVPTGIPRLYLASETDLHKKRPGQFYSTPLVPDSLSQHLHSQTQTLLSRLQVARRVPDGAQATDFTSFSWPSRVATHYDRRERRALLRPLGPSKQNALKRVC